MRTSVRYIMLLSVNINRNPKNEITVRRGVVIMLTKRETAYNELLQERIRRREEEREKFFMLFNIFCHEVKHVNPDLFPSCLQIEAMMNEAFGDCDNERLQSI